jgi:hypothetical protein
MKIPLIHSVFCLLVLSSFSYVKYRGLEVFHSSADRSNQHASGVFIGAHK